MITSDRIDPLVSIIVPVYNVERYLDRCIQSLISQSYKRLEILLINDGSTDNSIKYCEYWASIDPRIIVISKKNQGVSSARNSGIKIASGEYIIFIDSDDYVEPIIIERMVKAHDGKNTTIVISKYDRVSSDYSLEIEDVFQSVNYSNKENLIEDFLTARDGFYCCAMLCKKNMILKNELFFDETLQNLEDTAWIGIVLNFVTKLILLDAPLYHYRQNPNSITSGCIDRKWQASCWLKTKNSIKNYYKRNNISTIKSKYFAMMMRHCEKNFHAECFAGKLNIKQIIDIEESVNSSNSYLKRVLFRTETFFYQGIFRVRKTLFLLKRKE